MFLIVGFALKVLICVILFHSVLTPQELHFNSMGKLIAKVANPVYIDIFKMTKKRSDTLAPLFIFIIICIYGVCISFLNNMSMANSIFFAFQEMLRFLLIFYVVALLVGSTVNRFGMSTYSTFFYRIANPFVKLTRVFVSASGNWIIVPALIMIFIIFMLVGIIIYAVYYTVLGNGFFLAQAVSDTAANGLMGIVELVGLYTWLVIIRAIMSWVSPDPRNPVVQFANAMTDPVIEPFRRIIPPIGMFDISPIILLLVLYFAKMMLIRLISLL